MKRKAWKIKTDQQWKNQKKRNRGESFSMTKDELKLIQSDRITVMNIDN